MKMKFLKEKWIFDRLEIWGTGLVGVCSALAVFLPTNLTLWGAIPAAFLAIIICLSKYQSNKLESIEKTDGIARSEQAANNHRLELEKLRDWSVAENQRREIELAIYKERAESTAKQLVKVILEEFHRKYFKDRREDFHKHRTTLLVCVECEARKGREKHLKVFVRHGIHPDSRVSWLVDDNDPEKCRGVAGKIWFDGVSTVMTAACDWPANGDLMAKAGYANSLGITVEEAESLNVKSKAFTGAQILVRGERWGVLLLDSSKDGHIIEDAKKKKLLNEYTELIASMLNRIDI